MRSVREGDRMRYHGLDRKVAEILKAGLPRWERPGVVAICDSSRVLALFSAGAVIFEPPHGEDVLHVRLVPAG